MLPFKFQYKYMIINHWHIRAHVFILHLYEMVSLYDLYLFNKIILYSLGHLKKSFISFLYIIGLLDRRLYVLRRWLWESRRGCWYWERRRRLLTSRVSWVTGQAGAGWGAWWASTPTVPRPHAWHSSNSVVRHTLSFKLLENLSTWTRLI